MKFYEPIGEHQTQNNNIPELPGVYFFWSRKELIYIGYSNNLRKRIGKHFGEGFMKVISQMVDTKLVWKVSIMITKDKVEANTIEQQLIKLIPTKFNKIPFYKSIEDSKDNIKKALESYEELF